MKYLVLGILAISINAFSADCKKEKDFVVEEMMKIQDDSPKKYLEDGIITVTTKSGKVYKFNTDEYKVVKRSNYKKVDVVKVTEKTTCTDPSKKNALLAFIGSGPEKSPSVSTSAKSATISVGDEQYLGLQYQREIVDNVLLMGQGTTNGNVGLGLGIKFGE